MSHDKPDSNTLVFICDHCEDTYTFYGDEGDPVAQPHKCIARLHSIGWKSYKPVGYAWENYCPKCREVDPNTEVPRARS